MPPQAPAVDAAVPEVSREVSVPEVPAAAAAVDVAGPSVDVPAPCASVDVPAVSADAAVPDVAAMAVDVAAPAVEVRVSSRAACKRSASVHRYELRLCPRRCRRRTIEITHQVRIGLARTGVA